MNKELCGLFGKKQKERRQGDRRNYGEIVMVLTDVVDDLEALNEEKNGQIIRLTEQQAEISRTISVAEKEKTKASNTVTNIKNLISV